MQKAKGQETVGGGGRKITLFERNARSVITFCEREKTISISEPRKRKVPFQNWGEGIDLVYEEGAGLGVDDETARWSKSLLNTLSLDRERGREENSPHSRPGKTCARPSYTKKKR